MVDVTDVDDEMFDDGSLQFGWVVRPLLVGLAYACLFAGIAVFYQPQEESPVVFLGMEIAMLDWISAFALIIVLVIFGPALVSYRDRIRAFIETFVLDRFAGVSLAGLVGFVILATVGVVYVGSPEFHPQHTYNPPVGFSVEEWRPVECVGTVSDGTCHGSWSYPLGTDDSGRNLVITVVNGLQTSLQIGFSAAVLAGTIGTSVGLVAGTVGGRIDRLLMRYVDLQSAVPSFFAYVLLVALLNVRGDLVLIILVFGLLSWGGLSRLVRSEVVQVREELYVKSARAAGSGRLYRIRHHILPNVTTSVFVPLSGLIPLYILYEAALSFLGLGVSHPERVSLGDEIASGFDLTIAEWWDVWWIPVVPAIALVLLTTSILVVGDRLGELADPDER